MSRLAAFAALLIAGSAAGAQDEKPPAQERPPAQKEKPAVELDPKTKAAIEDAIERAKEDLRREVRSEIQGAQMAAEYLGAATEGPKLELFELDGYFRFRGQLLDNLDLHAGKDASGRYLFPIPRGASNGGTLSTANMRLRLEPTLNISEHVRVRAQIDVLDNHVLGSSTSNLFDDPGSPYPSPFYGSSRVVSQVDARLDRPYISPKRVWGEVQTPLGLLSFGRMPSEWGLGILANAGAEIDEDFGDSVDRIQFALPPVATPAGRLVFVPMLDFDNEGTLYAQPYASSGTGQPFDASQKDDGRTYGLKVAKLDTDDEVRRKSERGERSVNYGAYYSYRTQRFFDPEWTTTTGFDPTVDPNQATTTATIHRSAYVHVIDAWFRFLSSRWRIEAEAAGVVGSIGDAGNDPNVPPVAKVLLRQWGGAAVVDYKAMPNKLTVGGELGAASGDSAPGFGNRPQLGPQLYGSFEGAQWGCADAAICGNVGDRTISNFRFNPAYRVDLVLFHQILGQVTDALYVKPKVRWDILPGLSLDAQIVYSRALEKGSTPSVKADGTGGSANLGIEADGILTFTTGDGFQAWGEWGVLQPLGGLAIQDRSLSRGHVLAGGLAAKF